MAQTIVLRRSAQTGKVPGTSSLNLGEIAVNTYDGRVFFKKSGSIESIEHLVTTNSTTTGSITLTKTGSFGELVVVQDANFQRDIFVTRDIVGNGDIDVLGSLTASLSNGYIWVGNSSNKTQLLATASLVPGNIYITSSVNAPSTTYDNMIWYDSDTGKSYIRYNDGTSTQWVLQSDPTINTGPTLLTLQEVTDIGYTTDNPIIITNTTNATSSGSGALITSGGVGVLGDVWARKFYGDGSGLTGVVASYTETDTLNSVLGRGNTSANSIVLTGTTNATSKLTGVIRVAGGIGVEKDIYADNLVLSGTLTASLQTGYALVGNSNGTASAVATSSFSTLLPAGLLSSSNNTFAAYTSSTNTFTASASTRLTNLETKSASVDISISNLNSYTASASSSIFHLNASSASQQTSINAINTTTASLLVETANLELFTASASSSIFHLNASSASQQTSINGLNNSSASLNTFTSSAAVRLTNLETKSASVDISIANIHTFTASVSTSIFNINTYTASVSSSLFNHNASSASQQTSINALNNSTASLNTFTSSTAVRLTNLETKSASVDTSVSNINTFTASASTRLTNLETKSASVDTSVSNLNSFTSSVNTAVIFNGSDLIVRGNFYVSGSTTYISSSTLNIGDNIIELNYGGTQTIAGIYVRDATASSLVSGSLLWDATNDNWIAGRSGSESRILLANANNVLSSSISFNTYTASVDSSITNLNASSASQQTSINAINVATASLQITTASLNTFTASASTRLTNLESKSASVDISIAALNSVSASLNSKTGSYATTGSNIFVANQIISGNLDLSGSFTSSLLKGYVWVGDGNNRTTLTATSSFGGGAATYENTFDFNLDPSVGIIGFVQSENLLNQVSVNNNSIIFSSAGGNFGTFTTGSSYISSSFTASLQQGYVWVGDGAGKSIAFSTSSLVSGGPSFGTIAVSGQSDVIADVANDTLTLVAGTNVSITTNAAGDSITINSTGGSGDTSALNASTASLNTFTASAAIRFTNLESKSASVDTSISNLNTYTASASSSIFNLNTYTTSVSSSIFHLNASSASQQISINAINTATASLQTETANLETFTASAAIRLTNLESKSASVDISISNLNTYTASASSSIFNLNTYTTSVSSSIFHLNASSASQQTSINGLNNSTGSLNTFTASTVTRLTNLESKSASVDINITNIHTFTASVSTSIFNINAYTTSISSSIFHLNASSASQQTSINAINTATASLQTETANLETFTASAAIRLTNLESKSSSVDASISSINSKTGSYATTGSNTFVALQTISGSLDVSQSISSSLPQGYVLVGNGLNRTVVVATSSFGGGQTTDISALNASTASLNTFTASAAIRLTNLETTTASLLIDVLNLESKSASVDINIVNIHSFTTSAHTRFNLLEIDSASTDVSISRLNNSTASLNTFTASASGRLNSLELFSSSVDSKFATIGTQSGSWGGSSGGSNPNNYIKGISIYDPTNAEDVTMMYTSQSLSVQAVQAVLRGSAGQSTTITLRYDSLRNAAGTAIVSAQAVTTTGSAATVTLTANTSVPANNFIWLETTATAGTVNELYVQFEYA